MNKNPYGVLRRGPQEWGAQSRQDEDALRGMRRHGREQAIAEQLADMDED